MSMGLGAAAAFLLDPASGNRRRTRLREATRHTANDAVDRASGVGRDLKNRTAGVVAMARRAVRHEQPTDAVLTDRVRTALGRVVSNPHALNVVVVNGAVTLTGPVLAAEESGVIRAVRSVKGVQSVDARLEIHEEPGSIPSLQGARDIAS